MFGKIDRLLTGLTGREVLFIAIFSVGLLGLADYVTGHELSVVFFYLGPVALAAWYASRSAGIGIALLACFIWYLADIESGYPKSHPAIPVWNALVRFGFFLSNALLLAALRKHLTAEQQLARTDPMTGVLNNRAFSEQLEYSLALARRNGSPFTLAYIDLDDFKQINDTLGHAEGDRVLCAVARALQNSSRRTDVVARLGGDEFALLLPETDLSGARFVMGEIRQQLDDLSLVDDLNIACSIGAVAFPKPPSTAGEAVKAADKLMYEVKRQGKNAVALGLYDSLTGVAERVGTQDDKPAPLPSGTLPKSGNGG